MKRGWCGGIDGKDEEGYAETRNLERKRLRQEHVLAGQVEACLGGLHSSVAWEAYKDRKVAQEKLQRVRQAVREAFDAFDGGDYAECFATMPSVDDLSIVREEGLQVLYEKALVYRLLAAGYQESKHRRDQFFFEEDATALCKRLQKYITTVDDDDSHDVALQHGMLVFLSLEDWERAITVGKSVIAACSKPSHFKANVAFLLAKAYIGQESLREALESLARAGFILRQLLVLDPFGKRLAADVEHLLKTVKRMRERKWRYRLGLYPSCYGATRDINAYV